MDLLSIAFSNKYKIKECLGKGGFSEIFLVEAELGNKFAAKIMKIKDKEHQLIQKECEILKILQMLLYAMFFH